jgi:hypothetical protein
VWRARYGTLAFAIGHDMASPRRVVPIVAAEWERGRVTGGVMEVGSDVAVGRLAQPITDVAPIPVGVAGPADLGQKLVAVGYGVYQTSPLPHEGAPPLYGERKAGTLTLRAREGRRLLEELEDVVGQRRIEAALQAEATTSLSWNPEPLRIGAERDELCARLARAREDDLFSARRALDQLGQRRLRLSHVDDLPTHSKALARMTNLVNSGRISPSYTMVLLA